MSRSLQLFCIGFVPQLLLRLFVFLATSISAMSVDATGSGTAISPDQFTQLMEAITASQTRMDEKFSEFQIEVRQGQEEAAAKALKRARYEKPYTFTRKGNEEQATFNAKLDATVADAESELTEAGPAAAPALQRATEAIKKGRKMIAERQKLIKITDRSELGWGVVAIWPSTRWKGGAGTVVAVAAATGTPGVVGRSEPRGFPS